MCNWRHPHQESIVSTGGGTGGRPGYGGGGAAANSTPDPVPWDYCTPAPINSLEQDEVDRDEPPRTV